MTAPGSITLTRHGDVPAAVLAGEVDVYAVKGVTPAELERYRTDGVFIADLGAVTFLDSIGIGFLIELRKYASFVRLDNITPRTRMLLTMAGVDGHFSYDGRSPTSQHEPSVGLGEIAAEPDTEA